MNYEENNKPFTSHATWSKIDKTTDKHHTYSQANAVCDLIKKENTKENPCSIRGYCLCVWVTDDTYEIRLKLKRIKFDEIFVDQLDTSPYKTIKRVKPNHRRCKKG